MTGDIIRALRMERMADKSSVIEAEPGKVGRRANEFSMARFYERCRREEERLRKEVRVFCLGSEEARSDRIRVIERTGPDFAEEEVICAAFGLPATFLRNSFGSVEAALEASRRVRLNMQVRPKNFLTVDAADLYADYRRDALAPFARFAEIAKGGDPSLLVVEGGKFLGKTFLISQWFWLEGQRHFCPAVTVQCSKMSFDQILPTVLREWGETRVDPTPGVPPRLLVLDGWRVERDRGGLSVVLPGRRAPFADLVRVVNRLWADLGPFGVVLGVENNDRPITWGAAKEHLAPDAGCGVCRVDPFSVETGVRFLRARGCRRVSKDDLVRLASRCHGLPAALVAVAEEVSALSRVERERYLAAGASAQDVDGQQSSFDAFFAGWLSRHGSGEYDVSRGAEDRRRAHPHALLRLLAILHGPTALGELEEIVRSVNVTRVSGREIDHLLRGEVPFVQMLDGDCFDLHMLVGQLLRRELAASVASGAFDGHTSLKQLEAIHWKAAQIRRAALRHQGGLDGDAIGTVEAFVHHMIEQIRLIPAGDSGRRRRKRLTTVAAEKLTEFEKRPGTLNNAHLWRIAFDEAARLLLDRQSPTAPIHAQFEAKARIFAGLLGVAIDEGLEFSSDNVDLRKEIALCWMHAGRLQLALEAVTDLKGEGAVNDRVATDRLTLEAAIRLRLGHPIARVEDLLKSKLAESTRVALLPPASARSTDKLSMDERAAVRVLSRAAEVALQGGKTGDALVRFAQAAALQATRPPYILRGEAARRYAVALVRNRATLPNDVALRRARELVAANIEYARRDVGDRMGRDSNDLISMQVLDAGLSRVAGETKAAEIQLAFVKSNELMRRRELTYQVRAEFDLEEFRLDIAQWQAQEQNSRITPADLIERGEDLAARLKDSGHGILHVDTLVAMVELLPAAERDDRCRQIRAVMRTIDYPMRALDLEVLREGGSALKRLGL